ncbi:helicase-related protein [Uliginosibacterium sp. H1]|uniref:helicase-related protein n=1 Tax=Uliginosibacterium sp. H1 TaxID=3114757 RepID=UPI002E193265|nr:helicase-related protein [Uliginosibacterium sp. H1]
MPRPPHPTDDLDSSPADEALSADAPDDGAILDDIDEQIAARIDRYLAGFNARLLHSYESVAIEVSGEVAGHAGTRHPFRLVPDRGVLARIGKWRKLKPAQRLELVRERLNDDTLAELVAGIGAFVSDIENRAKAAGLDADDFLGALTVGRELASRRFRVAEDRLAEAIHRKQQTTHAEAALRSVPLARYPESFELAAGMRRKFIAILGPTNSGKTHQAMEALALADSGVYLAPLRLLALENYERLVERDVPVSLVTGEERRLTEGATHVASTIEMLDTTREVDIAVIDEIQMLEDLDRGAAWTAAVCGVPAHTVYLLGALAARPAIEALAKRLGCPLQVTTLQRKSPLEMEPNAVGNLGKLKRGDALIAFSRRDVLDWSAQAAKAGLKVAAIYGNLSPEVRRAQAQRFREGDADVVVATDAIGMGLNMPIRRVVFTTAKKYDGISEDILPAWLAHQIAGRAGRYGIHEAGHVAGFDDHTHRQIARLMKTHADDLPKRGFFVTPSLHQLESIAQATREQSLAKLLNLFTRNIDLSDDFFLPGNLDEQIERAQYLDTLRLTLAQRFTFSLVPISTRVASLESAWRSWAQKVANQRACYLSEDIESFERTKYPLQTAEDACKKYSAYAWLGYRLPDFFPDAEAAVEIARETSERVDRMLAAANGGKAGGHHRGPQRGGKHGERGGQDSRGGHLRSRRVARR